MNTISKTRNMNVALLGREDVAVYDASLQEWACDPAVPMEDDCGCHRREVGNPHGSHLVSVPHTISWLTAYRKFFTSKIKKHRGRVVDAKGDAILAEFASVVDAVNSAKPTS